MVYLSTADVLELFELHIGPRSALSRPELLESAVALPQATMFGEDLYPHIFQKAAALLRSIAQNQSFVDGNKRTGFVVGILFLNSMAFASLPARKMQRAPSLNWPRALSTKPTTALFFATT